MPPKDADRIKNSTDLDLKAFLETGLKGQSDLGPHCLHVRGLSKKFMEFVNKNKTTIPMKNGDKQCLFDTPRKVMVNKEMMSEYQAIRKTVYSAFACSRSCPVPGHVILTCKLHISGKI